MAASRGHPSLLSAPSWRTVACILAGGEGKRLFPLTARCAKPAVRFGGSYRLIDFPLSNCINSEIPKVLVFSQYMSLSLEYHLRQGWWSAGSELHDYIAFLPPQKQAGRLSYQGTADAVSQNLQMLERLSPAHVLILGSDHVYRMDYRRLLQFHLERGADVTVATFPVRREQAGDFGIVTADERARVTSFLEKPKDLTALPDQPSTVLASMGIYLFTFEALREVLLEDSRRQSTHDFGHDILPQMLGRYRVAAFPFVDGMDEESAYWRDVGTIDAYWEAHMDLLGPDARFLLQHPKWPLRTASSQPPAPLSPRWDPASPEEWTGTRSFIAQGCTIEDGRIDRSILSPCVRVDAAAEVQESILLDGVHIGRGAKVQRAILDRGTTVPPGTHIGYKSAVDRERFLVSPKGVTVVAHVPAPRGLEERPMDLPIMVRPSRAQAGSMAISSA